MKSYLKPKRQAHLLTDVIRDQDFAWNKYVKLFFACQCSGKCALIFDFVSDT